MIYNDLMLYLAGGIGDMCDFVNLIDGYDKYGVKVFGGEFCGRFDVLLRDEFLLSVYFEPLWSQGSVTSGLFGAHVASGLIGVGISVPSVCILSSQYVSNKLGPIPSCFEINDPGFDLDDVIFFVLLILLDLDYVEVVVVGSG